MVRGELIGPGDIRVTALAEISRAQPGEMTFIGAEKYAMKWADSQASVALVSSKVQVDPGEGRAIIRVQDADLAMATALEAFAPPVPQPPPGVHPTALIDPAATIGTDARVGAYCVVHAGAKVGDGTVLHNGVTLFDDAVVGQGCELWPGVVVRERCTVGDRCILHAHVILGTDGFGYRLDTSGPAPRMAKIPQIGTVQIGDDVELGAGVTVDRAKFDATVIGDGCKLDNQVQIAHNCVLGKMVVIAGNAAIAGSVTIGDGTMIGGMTCVSDHITIGKGVQLAGGAACINDIPDGETWGGAPARLLKDVFRETVALRKLPGLMREAKRVQRQIDPSAH